MPLGDSGKLADRDPVMIVGTPATTTSRSPYVVSQARLFGQLGICARPGDLHEPADAELERRRADRQDGKLLGVGSLIVREANDDDPKVPGNMFVPIDLLKPILAGSRARPGIAPARRGRGWACRPTKCRDGSSSRACRPTVRPIAPGIQVGDIILGVGGDGVRTQAEFYRKVWGRGGAGTEIPLKLLQGVDVREVRVQSIDRVEYFRPRTTY